MTTQLIYMKLQPGDNMSLCSCTDPLMHPLTLAPVIFRLGSREGKGEGEGGREREGERERGRERECF